MITILDKRFEPYIRRDEIDAITTRIADEITQKYIGENPIFVVMLSGAFMFAADVLRKVKLNHCEVTFVKFSSYEGTKSSGVVKALLGLTVDVTDRPVVVIEDLVESGLTMAYFTEYLKKQNPKSISIAVLFSKPHLLQHKELPVEFVGREISNEFIVGYGLDYNDQGRNLGEIYKIVEN